MTSRAHSETESAGARILVVDDDRNITKIIRSMLELDGHEVSERSSGVGLVAQLETATPNLILLDINMPDLSGVRVLEEIRGRFGDAIPVVMLTGETENVELAVDTFKHGASDYLIKPVAMDKLRSAVRATLKIHRLKLERERMHLELVDKNAELARSKATIEEVGLQLSSANAELIEAMRQLEAVFNSVSDGMLSVDGAFRIRQINRAGAQMAGLAPADAVGRPLTEVFRGRAFDREHLDGLRGGEAGRSAEFEIVGHDATVRHVSARVDPHEDPAGGSGLIVVLRDISELRKLREELRGRYGFSNMVGRSHLMLRVYELIEQIAPTSTTVLLEGESGTGKELIAHAVHYNSPRANRPFIRVNCSALAETLLESELFGHAKGAFTGAVSDKIGRFEAADSGTILLDEIGDISPLIQLKLLRVLQEREIERVGESRSRRVDVRVVTATNKDLKRQMREGRFREDLYYRLKVFPIQLPPLRARRDDIPLLVNHFVQKFRDAMGKPIVGGTAEALARLLDYHWPGNVRELENAIEHAFVKAGGERFSEADLPPEVRFPEDSGPDEAGRAEAARASRPAEPVPLQAERESIVQALRQSGWNKSRAARRLGIGRTTLWRKMRELAIGDSQD